MVDEPRVVTSMSSINYLYTQPNTVPPYSYQYIFNSIQCIHVYIRDYWICRADEGVTGINRTLTVHIVDYPGCI